MKNFWVIPFDFPQALGEFNRKDCKICKGLPNLQDFEIVRSKKQAVDAAWTSLWSCSNRWKAIIHGLFLQKSKKHEQNIYKDFGIIFMCQVAENTTSLWRQTQAFSLSGVSPLGSLWCFWLWNAWWQDHLGWFLALEKRQLKHLAVFELGLWR